MWFKSELLYVKLILINRLQQEVSFVRTLLNSDIALMRTGKGSLHEPDTVYYKYTYSRFPFRFYVDMVKIFPNYIQLQQTVSEISFFCERNIHRFRLVRIAKMHYQFVQKLVNYYLLYKHNWDVLQIFYTPYYASVVHQLVIFKITKQCFSQDQTMCSLEYTVDVIVDVHRCVLDLLRQRKNCKREGRQHSLFPQLEFLFPRMSAL